MERNNSYFIVEELDNDITTELLEKFFKENNVKFSRIEIVNEEGIIFARIFYNTDEQDLTVLEQLIGKEINSSTKLKIVFTDKGKDSKVEISNKFTEDEKIPYNKNYHEHVLCQFMQAPGDTCFKFIDQNTIERQRGIIKHLLSKIGTNLLSGNGIMSVSLPIRIFDERSLLEVFAHQCRLAPYFLEKGGEADNFIEKLKWTTAYAISRIHMSMTQLKPFNPIWGETFQCKIGDSHLYMEQSSHHPPIYHFLHLGKNFKAFGYQEPQASTGANSVTARTKGVYTVQYKDGTEHKIIPCSIVIGGTLFGDRTFSVVDKFYVLDEKNDYISYIEFNPDERGTFSKMFSKRTTFPDYFKGLITRISQTTCKDNTYTLNKNHTSFGEIKGEWSKNMYFDDQLVWDYNDYVHFELLRMNYTLPSDSTLRLDLSLLKGGNEEAAGEAKTKLEEIQRNDRKLRQKEGSCKKH